MGTVSASAQINSSGGSVGAKASAWSPSITIKFCGISISVGAEVIAVGGEIKISSDGLSLGAAALFGISINIGW